MRTAVKGRLVLLNTATPWRSAQRRKRPDGDSVRHQYDVSDIALYIKRFPEKLLRFVCTVIRYEINFGHFRQPMYFDIVCLGTRSLSGSFLVGICQPSRSFPTQTIDDNAPSVPSAMNAYRDRAACFARHYAYEMLWSLLASHQLDAKRSNPILRKRKILN